MKKLTEKEMAFADDLFGYATVDEWADVLSDVAFASAMNTLLLLQHKSDAPTEIETKPLIWLGMLADYMKKAASRSSF